ncbi:uncharacterized protein LOC144429946 [Styela clava]
MLHTKPPFFNHKEDSNCNYSRYLSQEKDMETQEAPLNLTCRKSSLDENYSEAKIKEECATYPRTVESWSVVQTPLLLPCMKPTSWSYPWPNFPLFQISEQSFQYHQAYWQLINNAIRSRMNSNFGNEEMLDSQSEIAHKLKVESSMSPPFVQTPKEDFHNCFSFGNTICDNHSTNGSGRETGSPKVPSIKQKTKKNNSAVKSNFKCSQCGVTYPHRFELNRHIKVSHVRPHRCEHCGKGFGHKNYLQVHIETVHLGRKIHKCDLCGKYLSTGGNLSVHIRTIHMGEKKYKCSVCSRTFGQQCNMKTHMKRHFFKQSEQKCVTMTSQC